MRASTTAGPARWWATSPSRAADRCCPATQATRSGSTQTSGSHPCDRRLTPQEREDLSATSMLAEDKVSVDPKIWTDAHVRLLKRAASYPVVERIFVHPAIKKALCEAT